MYGVDQIADVFSKHAKYHMYILIINDLITHCMPYPQFLHNYYTIFKVTFNQMSNQSSLKS